MKIFLLHIFILLGGLSFAHEYHIALGEVKYDYNSKTIQASLTVSTKDFEPT